jgi:hypothetical protein
MCQRAMKSDYWRGILWCYTFRGVGVRITPWAMTVTAAARVANMMVGLRIVEVETISGQES